MAIASCSELTLDKLPSMASVHTPIQAAEDISDRVAQKLAETETALRVLLEGRERDITKIREEASDNIKNMVLPYLESLKATNLEANQAELIEIIEKNLQKFYDPAYARLASPYFRLSPTEMKVAQFIRDGKTNKEIAKLMHLSKSTILTHRHHVREKLGIKNKKINLRQFLQS